MGGMDVREYAALGSDRGPDRIEPDDEIPGILRGAERDPLRAERHHHPQHHAHAEPHQAGADEAAYEKIMPDYKKMVAEKNIFR